MPLPTLPTRRTALDVTVMDFGGVNVLGTYRTFRHDVDISTEDGRSASSRYETHVPTKRSRRFSLDLFSGAESARVSSLGLSVYSVGGTSYLGDVESGTITFDTKTGEGSGARDFDEYPVATGTGVEVSSRLFVSSFAALQILAGQTAAASIANLNVACLLTLGGDSFSSPMLLSAGSVQIERDALQMQDITLRGRGTVVAPTGSSLLGLIATGSAAIQYQIATGGYPEIGYALMTRGSLSWQSGQIVTGSFEFAGQGLAAAS